jgi:methylated-DNA-protein-cysteine methyltransferase-like protein
VASTQKNFYKAVCKIVSSIAPGHVMSYGEVARAAGFPRHSRMVSKAIVRCTRSLPWHRVIKSDGTLAFKAGSQPYNKQKALLEKEGVHMTNGKFMPRDADDTVDLDKLIWGPENTLTR